MSPSLCRTLKRCAALLGFGLGAGLASGGCSARTPDTGPRVEPAAPIVFDDVTREAGIDFRHRNGAAGRKLLPETMGAGCALLDVDNDGRLDVLLVDGTSWASYRKGGPGAGQSRLYRNVGDGRFEDITRAFGLPSGLYGMGAAAGDFDNDGYTDVFLTALNDSRLLRNNGGRRFEDVTAKVGIRTPGWPTSAAFLDYNRDGRLDLFVCHYVRWSPETDLPFSLDGSNPSYARPDRYAGEPCQLWENAGARFVDVSRAAGVAKRETKALGVALCDFDRDGWVDLAVSNDTVPNFLFHNQGNAGRGRGSFKEVAVQAGMAVGQGGVPKAGMGIDVADYDNSGRDAILITNFSGEQISLYKKDESGLFIDVAAREGIGIPSLRYVGFGAFFFDADLDGFQDIVVANGHIQDDIHVRSSGVAYREPALLFRGGAGGAFEDVTAAAGDLGAARVGRGAGWGDWDNDGDVDLLLSTNGGAPALLRQRGRPRNHWLRLRLEGRASNRSAIGATVRLRAGAAVQTRMVRSGSSYLSQGDFRLTFGLGNAEHVDDIEVRWPNGSVQSFAAPGVDRELKLVERSGGVEG